MEITFPVEFTVLGTPLSLQAKNTVAKAEWKERVREASRKRLPRPHFASSRRVAVTMYHLPERPVEGDIDNIVKLILDALSRHIYLDDAQVERVVVQKFEPENVFNVSKPSAEMAGALGGPKPAVYVRISDDPFEEFA